MSQITITIKQATTTDLQTLTKLTTELHKYEKEIYPLCKGASYGADAATKMLQDQDNNEIDVFLAIYNDEAIGYIAGGVEGNDCDQFDTYYIEDLAVTEKYRSQGIGKQLLDYAQNHAKSKGFKKFGIGVLSANKRVLDYYIRYGFEVYGIELNKDIN
ncbi:MAG: hypothetical protein Fur003_4920 [Candidatus Dojkabacteria bacterium]